LKKGKLVHWINHYDTTALKVVPFLDKSTAILDDVKLLDSAYTEGAAPHSVHPSLAGNTF